MMLHVDKITYMIFMLGIVSIIIWGCENANEPKDTSNLLTPEITNLKVTNEGVSFKWTNRNTLHIDFEIERKIGNEDYKSFARLDYTYYGLTDSLLPNGVLANYRIRALYKTRTSGYGYSVPVLKCSTALIDSNFHDYYMYHVYKLTNEKFLLIGVKHDAPAQSLLFDPVTNQFSNSANLTRSIEGFSFALLDNGNVLLAGSRVGDTHLKQTFLYNVVSNTWSEAAELLYLQTENSSVRMPDGKILVTGGYISNGTLTNKCQLYDPNLNSWSEFPTLPTVRQGHAITSLQDGKILVAGGGPSPGNTSTICEIYDPSSKLWSPASSLNEKRRNLTSYLLPDNNIIVFESNGNFRRTEIYNIVNKTWSYGGERNTFTHVQSTTQLNDGRIMIVGITGQFGNTESIIEIYYPDINKWVLSNTIPYSPYNWSVVTSSDNKAYVFGGLYQSNVSVINLNAN